MWELTLIKILADQLTLSALCLIWLKYVLLHYLDAQRISGVSKNFTNKTVLAINWVEFFQLLMVFASGCFWLLLVASAFGIKFPMAVA